MISIVVPTFREAENITALVKVVDQVMKENGLSYQITVVDDDSRDGIEEKIAELGDTYPLAFICRIGKKPDLSESVLDGLYASNGEFAIVMDADLSHPATAIPDMVKLLVDKSADFVVGSRYVEGGAIDSQWNFWRFLNSNVATLLVKPLVKISDPMSGFFAFRLDQLPERTMLRPIGYKIGLELMVRGDFTKFAEVPILFHDRVVGESKMNLGQQVNYLHHLRRLYLYKFQGPGELIHFLSVGASGFVIDVCFFLLLQQFGVEHRLARALSFWPAVTSNWFFNRAATFSERKRRPKFKQWVEFAISSLLGFSINWGAYYLLTTYIEFFDHHHLSALFLGAGCGALSNFMMASLYVYNDKRTS